MNKLDFMREYRVKDRQVGSPTQGQYFTYGRRFAQLVAFPQDNVLTWYHQRLELIQKHVYLPLRTRILIVGAGYGFLHEVMLSVGYSHVTSVDNSPYIHQTSRLHSQGKVRRFLFNVDMLGDISSLGTFDIAITEDMISGVRPNQYAMFFNNLDALAPKVVHLVTTRVEGRYRHAPLSSWHRKRHKHIWIDILSGDSL